MEVAGVPSATAPPGASPSRRRLAIERPGRSCGSTPADKRNRPPFMLKTAAVYWRWRESNPRPNARCEGVYRFSRAFWLSGSAWRRGRRRSRIPVNLIFLRSGPKVDQPLLATEPQPLEAARLVIRALPLTRRERNCRCRQLKVLPNVRSSALHLRPAPRPHQSKPGHPQGFKIPLTKRGVKLLAKDGYSRGYWVAKVRIELDWLQNPQKNGCKPLDAIPKYGKNLT